MSVAYYVNCKVHNIAVFITDNKGNPFDREEVREYLLNHLDCDLIFINEYKLDELNIPVFNLEDK